MFWKTNTRLRQELARMEFLANHYHDEAKVASADNDALLEERDKAVAALRRAQDHLRNEDYNDALSSVREALAALGEDAEEGGR